MDAWFAKNCNAYNLFGADGCVGQVVERLVKTLEEKKQRLSEFQDKYKIRIRVRASAALLLGNWACAPVRSTIQLVLLYYKGLWHGAQDEAAQSEAEQQQQQQEQQETRNKSNPGVLVS